MYGFVITTAGEGLLARAAAGEGLTLTGVKFGSGAVASAAAAKALTGLISEKAAGTSSGPAVSGGQLSLIAEYRNDLGGGLTAGFTISEFGIFAKVGDDTPALLYYAALGDKAQPVQPISEGLDVHRFPVAVGVTGEVAVTLSYPAGAWVTGAQLEEALKEIDLSGYIPASEKGADGGVAWLKVIGSRLRGAGKPTYGLGGQGEETAVTVALETGAYSGGAEVSAIVSGVEYDAENMSANGETAPDGTLIIKKLEE